MPKEKIDKEESENWKDDGSEEGWGSFDRRMYRWCRKRYGPEIGEFMWRGTTMLNLADLEGEEWSHYCEQVWNEINERDSNRAWGL